MEFRPDGAGSRLTSVPYADEARAQDGWQGQGTSRSIETLKSDVVHAMARIGGMVQSFQRGSYMVDGRDRPGVQIRYSIEAPGGRMVYGRLDVAALPIRQPARRADFQRVLRRREDEAVAMALYNVVQALRAQWVLAQLNPGYVPLMPWLMADKQHTLTELWSTGAKAGRLLPAKAGEDAVEGDWRDV